MLCYYINERGGEDLALIICPECGKEVSDQSERCINCGYPLIKQNTDENEIQEQNLDNKVVSKKNVKSNGCLLVILFLLGIWILSLITNSPDMGSDDRKVDAWVSAKHVVESNLKSPSTAKFPFSSNSDGVSITELENGKWRVRGWVDAENGFGAKIRSNFSVDINLNGSTYTYENLNID